VQQENRGITPDPPPSQPSYGRLELIFEPKETVMNRFRHVRHIAGVLAGLAAALLAFGAAPAFAMVPHQEPGGPADVTQAPPASAVTHTVIVGGMPGWQITLIAIAAALLAAAAAVIADRARTGHRKAIMPAA
jgi:hypothetical protein